MKIAFAVRGIHYLDELKWKRTFFCQIFRSLNENNFIKLQEVNKEEIDSKNILPLFKKALLNGCNNSVRDFYGEYTYSELFQNSKRLSRQISNRCGSGSTSTVAFLCDNSALTLLMLWASWMSGQVVMPLIWNEPPINMNLYFIKANNIKLLLSPDKFEELGKKLAFANNIPLLILKHTFLKHSNDLDTDIQNKIFDGILLDSFYGNSGAFLFYERPNQSKDENHESKYILRTHKELNLFVKMAAKTWNLSQSDRILNITSYQFYGYEFIYNILISLSVGSHINILENFDRKSAWRYILGLQLPPKERYNILLAEARVYEELVQEYENIIRNDSKMIEYIKGYCLNNYRLMITWGHINQSVPLAWKKITGHILVENDFPKLINNLNEKKFSNLSHDDLSMRIRLVDPNRQIIVESNEKRHVKLFQSPRSPVAVGRLMVFKNETQKFHYTGKVVSYFKGVFKIVGLHSCRVQ